MLRDGEPVPAASADESRAGDAGGTSALPSIVVSDADGGAHDRRRAPGAREAWEHVLSGIVFLDVLAVGLVMPLLSEIGLGKLRLSSSDYGVVSSVFGVAQLIGSPCASGARSRARTHACTQMRCAQRFTRVPSCARACCAVVGVLSDRLGKKTMLLFSALCSFVAYVLLGFADTVVIFVLSRFIVGIGKQTMSVSHAYIAERKHEEAECVRAVGWINSVMSASFVLGPLLGGFLAERMGVANVPLVASAIFAFDMFVIFTLLPGALLTPSPQPVSRTQLQPSLPPAGGARAHDGGAASELELAEQQKAPQTQRAASARSGPFRCVRSVGARVLRVFRRPQARSRGGDREGSGGASGAGDSDDHEDARESLAKLLLLLVHLLTALAEGILMNGSTLELRSHDPELAAPRALGVLVSMFALASGLAHGPVGTLLSRRVVPLWHVRVCLLLATLSFLAAGTVSSPYTLIGALLVASCSLSGVHAPLVTLISRTVDSSHVGRAIGTANSMSSLGRVTSPLLAGFLVAQGRGVVFVFAAAVAATVGVLTLGVTALRKAPRARA